MKHSQTFNHIELFAGCGGLSLGLARAGFDLLLANELSPMAAETFAYNFFNENFDEIAQQGKLPKHTFWLSSQYKALTKRLRENPFDYPALSTDNTDIPSDTTKLKGKLLVGNIIELNKLLESNANLLNNLKHGLNGEGVDLVSGGPPCQSFSMAGLRDKNSDKNTLPWEFAHFVSLLQPKIALLENVTGILRAFKDKDGSCFHAWFEVAKVFASKQYIPLCLHINARLAGVPQNRPRFIMLAVRHDIFDELMLAFNTERAEHVLFQKSKELYDLVQHDPDSAVFGSLPCFDVMKPTGFDLFKHSFLHHLIEHEAVSVKDALDDLKIHNPAEPSLFIKQLNSEFSTILNKKTRILNHDHRRNSPLVRRRFRLYQILQKCNDRSITKAIFNILKGEDSSLSDEVWDEVRAFEYLKQDGTMSTFDNKSAFIAYLQAHPTKKQTQKALDANAPAPAALSIPDDACHYDKNELRVLTVREMARLQSFPDRFVFRSKITTGGQMRRFEVPQYTQVGNAVPPLLGLALGKSIIELLSYLPSKRDSSKSKLNERLGMV